jgi:hypothetical protein
VALFGGAKNAVAVPVVDYAPDPNGAGLFAALTRRGSRDLNGPRAVIERCATWYGWTAAPQEFRGAAGLGNGRPLAPRNSELSKETTMPDSTTAAIFASRMARGRQ